jgi:hypothetical protein
VLFVLMIAGCGLFGGDPALPPQAPAPEAAPSTAPAPKDATSAPVRVPPRPEGCHHFFSEQDANQAFGVLSDTESGCAFEGVRVQGSEMVLRFKPDPAADAEVSLTARNATCDGPGEVVGGLRIGVPDETRSACPKAVEAVRALATSGSLPTGTEGSYGE